MLQLENEFSFNCIMKHQRLNLQEQKLELNQNKAKFTRTKNIIFK